MKWQCQCRRSSKRCRARRQETAVSPWRRWRFPCTTSRSDRVPQLRWGESREQLAKAVFGLDRPLW